MTLTNGRKVTFPKNGVVAYADEVQANITEIKSIKDSINTITSKSMMCYELVDGGIIARGQRKVIANPFGNTPCITYVEVYIYNRWFHTGFIFSQGGIGVSSGWMSGEGIVIQAGNAQLTAEQGAIGSTFGSNSDRPNSATCRVHVWAIA